MNEIGLSTRTGRCEQEIAEEHSDVVFWMNPLTAGDLDVTYVCYNCLKKLVAKTEDEYREEIRIELIERAKRDAKNAKRERRLKRLREKKWAERKIKSPPPVAPQPIPLWLQYYKQSPLTINFREGEPSKYR